MNEEGLFVEFAQVHGMFYGTSFASINAVMDTGRVCVLDVDVQGVRSLRNSPLLPKFVFITSPSIDCLEERLRGRGTETEVEICKCLKAAEGEMEVGRESGLFDDIIVNDDLSNAYQALRALVVLDVEQRQQFLEEQATAAKAKAKKKKNNL
eukprot:JP447250.1.p2 GENE.JP447250.1~~JP447250.1.p2  ORF type:complete len:152 (+),score=51.75 JP447250.1:47-502(+)